MSRLLSRGVGRVRASQELVRDLRRTAVLAAESNEARGCPTDRGADSVKGLSRRQAVYKESRAKQQRILLTADPLIPCALCCPSQDARRTGARCEHGRLWAARMEA